MQTLDSSYITVFDYFSSWIEAQHQRSSVFCPQSICFEALELQKSVRMTNSDVKTSSACKGQCLNAHKLRLILH